MEEKVKGLLIDSAAKSIKEMEFESIRDISVALHDTEPTFGIISSMEGHSIFYDDESLVRGITPGDPGVMWPRRYAAPLLGNLIILGVDNEGNSIDASCEIDDIMQEIIFINLQINAAGEVYLK